MIHNEIKTFNLFANNSTGPKNNYQGQKWDYGLNSLDWKRLVVFRPLHPSRKNVLEDGLGCLVHEGWNSGHELVQANAQAPPIDLFVVRVSKQKLGS